MKNSRIRDFIGHEWQDSSAVRIDIIDGKASKSRAVLMDNRSGISMTVLEDRCLDIFTLKVKGYNIPFLSKCGVVHPAFYDASQYEWLRNFGAGFLTTCGLTQAGEPCSFNNNTWGLHGPISNTPAQDVSVTSKDDEIVVSGKIRQYKFQTEDILLERSVSMYKTQNRIRISDKVTNEGWREAPFMLLYHFNFGYPLLNPESCLVLPPSRIEGWDEYSESMIGQHLKMCSPDAAYNEQTFIHKPSSNEGRTGFLIADAQTDPRMAVFMEYDRTNLPYILQWKHFKPGEYVMAVEPCNNHVKGAQWENANGTLQVLKKGESKSMDFMITFLENRDEIINAILKIK